MGRYLLWGKILKRPGINRGWRTAPLVFFFLPLPALFSQETPVDNAPWNDPAAAFAVPAAAPPLFDRPLRQREEKRVPEDFWLPGAGETLPSMDGIIDGIDSIDGIENGLTLSFIQRYQAGGNKVWLQETLERGELYFAFIQDRIRAKNIPAELLYLPAIESAFVQTVVSRSGAAGLWQFMRNSMHPWLKFSGWVDERLDFWASTEAALAKLQSNYLEIKDWPLALAAYNSGLGAIRSVLKKYPGKNYWELSAMNALKAETVYYVPKLLAVYYIASNPRRTGFEQFWPKRVDWEQVPLERQADVRVLAELAGLDPDELRLANAELRYFVTPPDGGYRLKVRAEVKDRVADVIAQTEIPLARAYLHIVTSGDTIYGLARRYGVPEAHIFNANPGIQERALQIGRHILIPALQ
jgi:membrane-bound lytic murein transglycosylase D